MQHEPNIACFTETYKSKLKREDFTFPHMLPVLFFLAVLEWILIPVFCNVVSVSLSNSEQMNLKRPPTCCEDCTMSWVNKNCSDMFYWMQRLNNCLCDCDKINRRGLIFTKTYHTWTPNLNKLIKCWSTKCLPRLMQSFYFSGPARYLHLCKTLSFYFDHTCFSNITLTTIPCLRTSWLMCW